MTRPEKDYKALYVSIGRSEGSTKLYKLEDQLSEKLLECAKEWSRLVGLPESEYWTIGVSSQIFNLMQSVELRSSLAAAKAFKAFYKAHKKNGKQGILAALGEGKLESITPEQFDHLVKMVR